MKQEIFKLSHLKFFLTILFPVYTKEKNTHFKMKDEIYSVLYYLLIM